MLGYLAFTYATITYILLYIARIIYDLPPCFKFQITKVIEMCNGKIRIEILKL